jgi:hypothetical protein
MASQDAADTSVRQHIFSQLLVPRDNPFPASRPASLDDVVFLSAALTRLVIDPYREACTTETDISRWRDVGKRPADIPALNLAEPILITGFDEAPAAVKSAMAGALNKKGCAYIGRHPLSEAHPAGWLQLVQPSDRPDAKADGLIYVGDASLDGRTIARRRPDQLLGMVATAHTLSRAIPVALDRQLDVLLLDCTAGLSGLWPELQGPPDLTVMRDAIALLRKLGREEEIALINFGGMRSGTDVAKALALNCSASVFGLAAALAMGAAFDEPEGLRFPDTVTADSAAAALENWITATSQEVAIIARCTGKTSIHNLEPEDMRCITLATSKALDIPLASGAVKREGF